MLEPWWWLLVGPSRRTLISSRRFLGKLVTSWNSPSILNDSLTLRLRSSCNSLTIIVFNLIERYQIWMWLLHVSGLICSIRTCSCLIGWEILWATQIRSARGCNDACLLRILKTHLTHLLHLWLDWKTYTSLWGNYPWRICHIDTSIIGWSHEVISSGSKADETFFIFLLFLLCRHVTYYND